MFVSLSFKYVAIVTNIFTSALFLSFRFHFWNISKRGTIFTCILFCSVSFRFLHRFSSLPINVCLSVKRHKRENLFPPLSLSLSLSRIFMSWMTLPVNLSLNSFIHFLESCFGYILHTLMPGEKKKKERIVYLRKERFLSLFVKCNSHECRFVFYQQVQRIRQNISRNSNTHFCLPLVSKSLHTHIFWPKYIFILDIPFPLSFHSISVTNHICSPLNIFVNNSTANLSDRIHLCIVSKILQIQSWAAQKIRIRTKSFFLIRPSLHFISFSPSFFNWVPRIKKRTKKVKISETKMIQMILRSKWGKNEKKERFFFFRVRLSSSSFFQWGGRMKRKRREKERKRREKERKRREKEERGEMNPESICDHFVFFPLTISLWFCSWFITTLVKSNTWLFFLFCWSFLFFYFPSVCPA